MGAKIRMDRIFSKLQKLWQNRWWADGIRVEHFPRIWYDAAQRKSQKITVQIGRNTRNFNKDISCGTKDSKEECLANARLVSLYAKSFEKGQWSFIGPGSEKKWYCISEDSSQGIWDKIAERMLLEFADSGCPIFRCNDPIVQVNSKAKDMENCRYTMQPIWKRLRLFFANCFCKPGQSLRSSRRDVWRVWTPSRENGDPLWWDNQVPHSCSVRSRQKFLWILMTQQMNIFCCNNMENELRNCHNKINWVNFVWMQDFWMLLRMDSISWRTTREISQFHSVACREYSLPREDEASQLKGWIQGNTKIGPVLEVATSYLHGKYGVEIRIWSLNRDNTHSWVRISHGSNKFVMDVNKNETEFSKNQIEEYALKLNAKYFACRSKAKAKPQRREPAGSSPRIVPIERRNWIDIEPGKYSFSEYEVSKKVTFLLRQSQHMHREEDGGVHFWRKRENLQHQFPQSIHSSDDRWKACLAARGGVRRRFQYCTDDWGTNVYFRAPQGHSGRNLIDPSLQDNVVIPSNFFQHIYHIGCAFNLHSIINTGLTPGGQSSSKRQTLFFLPVDLMDKNHKDPDVIDLSVPRRAECLGRTDPSQCNVEIKVVSIANCAPPNNGSPLVTISNRRASPGFGAAKSISRTMTFVVTRAPPSRQILCR